MGGYGVRLLDLTSYSAFPIPIGLAFSEKQGIDKINFKNFAPLTLLTLRIKWHIFRISEYVLIFRALACQATHMLTGGLKDFGRFMNRPKITFGIRIGTVADFLNHLN